MTCTACLTSLNCGFALVANRTQNRKQDCYNLLQRDDLHCLPDLLELYIPSRTLRSSVDDRIFGILNGHKFQGQHAFSSIFFFVFFFRFCLVFCCCAVWLLRGRCHVNQVQSRRTFCVHHTATHQFTVSLHSKPHT